MNDVVVDEAAHHVDDSVHLADVGKKFVSKTFAFGSALHQTGDIYKFNGGGGEFLRFIHLSELVQAFVRNGHHAHIGLDGAEGIVGGLGARVGNGVKKCAFAHVGQTDDS